MPQLLSCHHSGYHYNVLMLLNINCLYNYTLHYKQQAETVNSVSTKCLDSAHRTTPKTYDQLHTAISL